MIGSSYPFFIRDGKILLSRRFQTGYEDGKYSLPAGHVEDNETLRQTLCREAFEEIGVTVRPEDITLVVTMHRKKDDIRMDFFWVVHTFTGEPENREPEKCDDLAWFPLTHLPPNTIPYIRHAIEAWQQGETYVEDGWEKT